MNLACFLTYLLTIILPFANQSPTGKCLQHRKIPLQIMYMYYIEFDCLTHPSCSALYAYTCTYTIQPYPHVLYPHVLAMYSAYHTLPHALVILHPSKGLYITYSPALAIQYPSNVLYITYSPLPLPYCIPLMCYTSHTALPLPYSTPLMCYTSHTAPCPCHTKSL